jgi:nucleoside-diphosphate-sugar epimerase
MPDALLDYWEARGLTSAEFWRGKRALVVGVSGFLGGWIARKLIDAGADVVGLSRSRRDKSQLALSDLSGRVSFQSGDASDKGPLAEAVGAGRIDAIFQCASMVDVSAALRKPARAFHDSVNTTLNILEFVRTQHPEAIVIVASSDKAYGTQQTPYKESFPLRPIHPYEIAKATQDLLAQSYGKMYGLKVGITRCGNFFGPYDFAFERIIPYTVQQLLKGEPPVLRSDGSAIRDFLYIEEAANAHLMLAKAVSGNHALRGETFNFSHEVSISVREMIDRIAAVMGSTIKPVIAGTAKGEISIMQLDCAKAREKLSWHPARFDEYLAKTVKWYCQNIFDH